MKRAIYKFVMIAVLASIAISISFCTSNTKQKASTIKYNNENQKIAIMTFVNHEILNSIQEGIQIRLKEIGYKDENIKIINANGEMDKVNLFAKQLATSNYNILIPISTPVSQSVIKASAGKTPIVYTFVSDPASIGVINNKAPHNVTGLSDVINYEGNLKLIKKILPKITKIGLIYNASESNSVIGIKECRRIGPSLNIKFEEVAISSSNEILNASRLIINKVDAIYIGGDNTVVSGITALVKVGKENNKPIFASDMGSVKEGAVMALSVDYTDFGKKTADIVDRILKGEKTNNISPIKVLGTKLIVNKGTLRYLDLSIPKDIKVDFYF
jgi:putative ABC transport system substrate-binding protein